MAELVKAQHLPYKLAPAAERGTVAFAPAKGEEYTIEETVVRWVDKSCQQNMLW